ncbi:uncharacterized protein NFIA_036250 [Aspergillus fischeri NRRL 181]|uniref:BTB domain-containing protein n=1 Tax=Neosartorya fischeri (strain ATCC 1020 / DSM 3700 / CBS 544.65 / FGSC A1164 / JCM 1740 / NRRL 181 / WB 181) TaxID=331117 RepID=A1CZ83_NEOFI|nr:conserved hypothetical protein [Aspergillus fischeri NRRL 181]EAW24053.1 conserved hypothetical protein [Aspergillus fischeri NRRL 181]
MGNRKKKFYSKKNGESNLHLEEPQASGLERSLLRDSQIEYNQPESSTYMIPVCYIQKYFQFDSSLSWESHYKLSEVDEEVGHTIVHFLCTGSYETLRTASDSGLSNMATEYRRSMLVYHAARKYDLYDLEMYAKKYIKMFGESMSAFDSMEAARKIYSKLPQGEVWLPNYLHEQLRVAFLSDTNIFQREEFYDGVGEDPDFDKAVMRMVVNIYSEALSKQGTEAIPEETHLEDSVAKEGTVEGNDVENHVSEETVAEVPVAEETVAEDTAAEVPVAEDCIAEECVAEGNDVEDPVAEEAFAEDTDDVSFDSPAEPSRTTLDFGWGKNWDTGSKLGSVSLDAGNGRMERDTNWWHSKNEAGESVGFSVPHEEIKYEKKKGNGKKNRKKKEQELAEPVRTSTDNCQGSVWPLASHG